MKYLIVLIFVVLAVGCGDVPKKSGDGENNANNANNVVNNANNSNNANNVDPNNVIVVNNTSNNVNNVGPNNVNPNNENNVDCPAGQVQHPVSGECVDENVNNANNANVMTGLTCPELLECLQPCEDDTCATRCLEQGAPDEQQKVVAVYACIQENCGELPTGDEIQTCAAEFCIDELNACFPSP